MNRLNRLARLAVVASTVTSTASAADIFLPPICPCDMADWAVQSFNPTTVGGVRKLLVRVANVGAGTTVAVPAKIDVWSLVDPFDPSDDYLMYTERCGLTYVIRKNGTFYSSGSVAIPPIGSGSWTDIPVSFPATADTWSVSVEVRPRFQPFNIYQAAVPLAECYSAPASGACLQLTQFAANNAGSWMTPAVIIKP